MLADEIATYLAATTSLGLTAGINLWAVPFPETAPAKSVCVVEYAGSPALRSMGGSLGTPHMESARFQVIARSSDLNSADTARRLAEDVYQKLDHLTSVAMSGTTYYMVTALAPPFFLGQDENARYRYAFNCEALKARST